MVAMPAAGALADWLRTGDARSMPEKPPIPTLALRINDAAAACGVGRDEMYAAFKRGDLVFCYPTSRPVIEVRELDRWLKSLPTERPKRGRAKASP